MSIYILLSLYPLIPMPPCLAITHIIFLYILFYFFIVALCTRLILICTYMYMRVNVHAYTSRHYQLTLTC